MPIYPILTLQRQVSMLNAHSTKTKQPYTHCSIYEDYLNVLNVYVVLKIACSKNNKCAKRKIEMKEYFGQLLLA